MANLFLYITHVDDSLQGRQGPSICLWGIPQDRHRFRILIELFIETIRQSLDQRHPPLNLTELDSKKICCVLINNQWLRATIPEVKLNLHGTINVFCIDIGSYHSVPLTFVRSLNFHGNEEENLRNWPPLANIFLLADIVAPLFEAGRQWSESAMMFLKMHVEKRVWNAILIGKCEKYQCVRLFCSNYQLLATIMIERKMGVPVTTYQEYMEVYTSAMCRIMDNFHAQTMAPPDTSYVGGNVPKLPISNATNDNSITPLENGNKTAPTSILEIPFADLTDEQDLYVTFTEKPGYFFGQFKKMFHELDKMTNELDEVYSSVSFPTLLYADVKSHLFEYGVLKLQMYYRVRIIKELVNDAEVLFIDYGMSVLTSRCKILAPLECLTLFRQPPFGIHCQLENDVTLSFSEWRKLTVEKFTKVKIGKCTDGICYVTLTNDPCNGEIAKILFPVDMSKKYHLESGLKLRKDSFPPESVSSSGRLLRSNDRSFKTLDNNVSVTVTWGSRSDVEKLEELVLPEMFKPSTSLNQQKIIYPKQLEIVLNQQVEAVFVNGPSSFYVQFLNSWSTLLELNEKINAVYSDESKPAIKELYLDSPCVVLHKEDNQWYRGRIVKICDSSAAIIHFVDYGNTQRFSIEQVKVIDEEFLKLPPLAYHCKLDGVDVSQGWTAEQKRKFENRAMGKLFSATSAVRDSDGKYPVRLVEKTKERKLFIKQHFGTPSFAKIPPPSAGYTSHRVSDKPMSVTVSYYDNPFRFFLSPLEVTFQEQLKKLEKLYSSHSPDDLIEDKPNLGLPCMARSIKNGHYYRSQILSIHDKMAEILFVDYGNQQATPLSELKRISPRLMEFPQMTWHCKLKGVKLMSTTSEDVQKHINACFATNEELSALFHPSSLDGSVFEVDLTIPKIGDASRYLIEQKVVERDFLEAAVELPTQDVNFVPQQIISAKAATGFFKSPTEFWVQLEPKAVDVIMERLDKLALDPEFINKKDLTPSIGKPCLAFYEADKHWYRATIEAVKEDCATICYIDYGNSCHVKTYDIRGLPSEFAQQPALAFKCCQDGAEKFSVAESEDFEDIVLNVAHYSVKFLKAVNGSLCVRLSYNKRDVCDLINNKKNIVSATTKLATTESSGTVLPVTEYSSLPVPEAPIGVYVSWYDNPCRFFLTSINLCQYKNQLEELEIFYSSLSPKELMEDRPTVGLPCVARYKENDHYYRSEILSIRELIAELLFVDFGNKQNTHLSQLKRMVPRFMEIPKLTWNCKLAGVKMATLPINPDAQSHLASCFLTGKSVSAVFHSASSVDSKGVFEVDLAVPKIGDVSEYLIRNKILERISNLVLPAQNVNFLSNQIISTRAVASYVKSPTEFWVHLDPESLDLVTDLIDELVLEPGFSSNTHFTASRGKSCLAFFSEDNRWYRATVETVNKDTAKVYYLDYGNNSTVKTTDLRELPVQLTRQSALAFKCSLDGSKSLSKDAITSFETFILGIPAFTIKCLYVSDGVLIVRLYSSAGMNLMKQLHNGKVTLPPIQEEPVELITEVESTELIGQISYCSSPNTFWFQLQRNNDEMDNMEIQLNQLCQKNCIDSSCVKEKPNANQVYVIKHPENSTWHRALVLKVFVNTADVYLLDYGDTRVVPFANIFALPNQFQLFPPFAIRCRLKTIWKPVELTSVLLEKLNAVCFEPGTPCKLMCERYENGIVSINSLFVGEQNISELLATNIANEECEKSITLAQHIALIGGKSWVGEEGRSGLKSPLVIQYVDLM